MKRFKKQMILGAGALGLALLSGIVLRSQSNTQTIPPRHGPVVEAVYGLGTVVATRVFRVKVGVTLTISKIYVREGDIVAAGAPLVSFGESNIQRAPFAGTVTNVAYKEGENVFPQSAVLTLMNLKDLYVEVSLEQQGALRVRIGQKAMLSFESMRGQKFEGKVRSVFPNEGQFLVDIDIPGLPQGILPGMTADVAIEVAKKDDALLIPVRAITGGKVFVLRNGKKLKIDVQLGVVDGEQAEVTGGSLLPDDLIIVKGK